MLRFIFPYYVHIMKMVFSKENFSCARVFRSGLKRGIKLKWLLAGPFPKTSVVRFFFFTSEFIQLVPEEFSFPLLNVEMKM